MATVRRRVRISAQANQWWLYKSFQNAVSEVQSTATATRPDPISTRMPYLSQHTFIRRTFSSVNHRPLLRYLLILDFEATCEEESTPDPQEIIEFPTVVYDLHLNKTAATFHEYVKPIHHRLLSDYCVHLTGIKQSTVDKAATFPGVWTLFNQFLSSQKLLEDPNSFTFLTCGNWDLKTMLPSQLELSARDHPTLSAEVPSHFRQWINIKRAYGQHYGSKRPGNMTKMMGSLGLRASGKLHSGIDDCRNLARIVTKMREDGWKPHVTSNID